MSLVDCLNVIITSDLDNLDEAQAALIDAKDNSPLDLVQALAEMVQSENYTLTQKSQLIGIMTMPIKREKGFFSPLHSVINTIYCSK